MDIEKAREIERELDHVFTLFDASNHEIKNVFNKIINFENSAPKGPSQFGHLMHDLRELDQNLLTTLTDFETVKRVRDLFRGYIANYDKEFYPALPDNVVQLFPGKTR